MQIFKPVKTNDSLFKKHESMLKDAMEAVHKRLHYSPFPEMPSPKDYGETAEADQKQKFESQLDGKFERLKQGSDTWLTSDEESPYTSKALSLSYPAFSNADAYIKAAEAASSDWKRTDAKTRVGILIESLYRLKNYFFELAFATMHTTGQSYLMSFQASGPHASDRALEAIALG